MMEAGVARQNADRSYSARSTAALFSWIASQALQRALCFVHKCTTYTVYTTYGHADSQLCRPPVPFVDESLYGHRWWSGPGAALPLPGQASMRTVAWRRQCQRW